MKLKVLHITPWFPNKNNTIEGVFILEHIKALEAHCDNEVLHISFSDKNEIHSSTIEGIQITKIIAKTIIDKWFFKEKKATKIIRNFLESHTYDMVNFHIAYPNAIGIKQLKNQFKNLPFVITEHWSAFHYKFNLTKKSKGRKRIENIFDNDTPVIVVSNALKEDIKSFTGNSDLSIKIIPNCVNTKLFNYQKKEISKTFTFCSINNWNQLKNPFVLIEAFEKLAENHQNIKLIIAGEGPLSKEITHYVSSSLHQEKIKLIGRINKSEVANLLKKVDCYCQSSNYETFSVICAEAITTGTPVICSNKGGMVDIITDDNGIVVEDLKINSWVKSMENLYVNYEKYNLEHISEVAHKKYNSESIGIQYFEILKSKFLSSSKKVNS